MSGFVRPPYCSQHHSCEEWISTITFFFFFGAQCDTIVVDSVCANFEERTALSFVPRRARGSSGLFPLTTVVSFLCSSSWLAPKMWRRYQLLYCAHEDPSSYQGSFISRILFCYSTSRFPCVYFAYVMHRCFLHHMLPRFWAHIFQVWLGYTAWRDSGLRKGLTVNLQ